MADKLEAIRNAIVTYDKKGIESLVQSALDAGMEPQKIIDEALVAAMDNIGRAFSSGDIYVAEMLVAALTMQAGLDLLRPCFPQNETGGRGTFLIGTVKGDLHDIGKNIVCMMVEGAGFNAVDLGVDVDADTFVREATAHQADVVGLSSLLTTSMPSMSAIVSELRLQVPGVKIVVGGAPVTNEFADKIGASGYAADAVAAVDLVRALVGR